MTSVNYVHEIPTSSLFFSYFTLFEKKSRQNEAWNRKSREIFEEVCQIVAGSIRKRKKHFK